MAQAQALEQTGGGFSHGTTSTTVPGFGGVGGRDGLFRGRGSFTGFQGLLDQHVQPIYRLAHQPLGLDLPQLKPHNRGA